MESGRPLVSVVVVSFSQARFLADAVASALAQNYPNTEIIIADDGSRDGSVEVVEALAARYPARVRARYHPGRRHLGVGPTYAMAIADARGEYVAFLEADDRWSRDFLTRKIEILTARADVGVVFSPYKVTAAGWYGWDMVLRQWLLGLTTMSRAPFDNVRPVLRSNNVATFSAVVTRRALLEEISLDAPGEGLLLDWWVLAQLSLRSRFCVDRTSVVHWRLHDESALGCKTASAQKALVLEFLPALYTELQRQAADLPNGSKDLCRRQRELLPFFDQFYRWPRMGSFLALLRRNPRWAVESLASHVVNGWKRAS